MQSKVNTAKAVEETVERVRGSVQNVVNLAQEQADKIKKAVPAYNSDAVKVWTQGCETVGKQVGELCQHVVEKNVKFVEKCANVKTYKDYVDLQTDHVAKLMERVWVDGSKISETWMKVCSEVTAPLQKQCKTGK